MQPGTLIDERFLLQKIAGRGGMGEVWQALDTHTQDTVAIKLLPPTGVMHLVRFEREAQLLLSLRHPNIVKHLGHGHEAKPYYIVMEWLEGEPLSARLKRGPLSIDSSIHLLQTLAQALSFVHQQKIIHRDIKPQNIFLLPREGLPEIKLIDFGLARPTLGGDSLTQTGTVLGTLGYTAPEQARGTANIDERADIFSLGCVLFECLTGRAPFMGDNAVSIFAKILLEKSPSIRVHQPNIPTWLEALVEQMLSKAPEDRPQNAQEILQQIEAQSPAQTRKSPALSIGDKERHLYFVLLIGTQPKPSTEDTEIAAPRELQSLLQTELERIGGQLEALVDGSLVVLFSGNQVATDQARKVARVALSWRPLLQGPMALTFGRGESSNQLGDALERAAKLFQEKTDVENPIWIDPLFGELLHESFLLAPSNKNFLLQGTTQEHRQRTLLGKPTPFVGRERELASLLGFFEQCVGEEQAQALIVTGAAGSGKSRLGRELLQSLRDRDEHILLRAEGDPLRAGTPFALIAQALRTHCGIAESDPLQERQKKSKARLEQDLPAAQRERVSEFLGLVMGIPPLNGGSAAFRSAKRDAQLMNDQMRRAFEDWLSAALKAPVVFLLEDLHWGDSASVRLLDSALRLHAERPLFVLAFARPEVNELFPRLWEERGAQHIKLQALSKKAIEKLIRQALPEKATKEVISAIQEKSAGNAFFIEELIRAVHQGREQLPETVLAMASARLEELSNEERRILRAASVFGTSFLYDGLIQLLGGEDALYRLQEHLQALIQREFLVIAGEGEYHFRHGLIREAAYASLTENDKQLGHRIAARWLASTPSAEPSILAEHLERAGLPQEAIHYYRDAANNALQADDLSLVHSRYQKALDCGAQGDVLADLETMVAESYAWQGNFIAAKKIFLEAQQKSTPQSFLWWKSTGGIALTSIFGSDFQLLPEVLEQFESHTPGAEVADVFVVSAARTVPPWLMLGQKERANLMWEKISKLSNKNPPLEPDSYAWMLITRGSIAFWRDANPWTAFADYQSAIQIFEDIGANRSAGIARYFPVPALRALGALEEAEQRIRENLQTLSPTDIFTRCYCYISLCEILALQGRSDEALQLEPILQQHVGTNFFLIQASKVLMAQAYFSAQDFTAARQRLESVSDTPFPVLEAVSNGIFAKMYVVEQKLNKALPYAQRAYEYVKEHGTGGSFAPRAACLSYAFILDSLGEHEQAREVLSSTYEELVNIAAKIPDEKYRKSFLEDAHENAGVIQLARQWQMA
jgi:serine/threonine protein kinase